MMELYFQTDILVGLLVLFYKEPKRFESIYGTIELKDHI